MQIKIQIRPRQILDFPQSKVIFGINSLLSRSILSNSCGIILRSKHGLRYGKGQIVVVEFLNCYINSLSESLIILPNFCTFLPWKNKTNSYTHT